MNLDAEWLEPDGRGGFASGTVSGERTRRYHALLLPAVRPPVARMALVNGLEVMLETEAGAFALSTQRYPGGADGRDVIQPRGLDFLVDFQADPWPRWTYQLPDGIRVEHEVFIHQTTGLTALSWRWLNPPRVPGVCKLAVRPLLSGRDYHALHQENPSFNFLPSTMANEGRNLVWQPYSGVPGIRVWSSGPYQQESRWYRRFLYTEERSRGLDCLEDLASPGVFTYDLGRDGNRATLLLGVVEGALTSQPLPSPVPAGANAARLFPALRDDEQRRRAAYRDPLRRATDAYLVCGGRGETILAGYPWFTDWGRDTFISLRGLCLAMGRFEDARDILLPWATSVSEGMLPNRFPDGGEKPEYNSVDASLWFIIAAHDYLASVPPPPDEAGLKRWSGDQLQLLSTCEAILTGYANGTRYGIRLDPEDGLLYSGIGAPDVALTWMDARVDNQPVTRRAGKAVEIQALWLNALYLMSANSTRWRTLHQQGAASFVRRFWHPARACLFDVVDVDGVGGRSDASLRPNQIFAVGGLPLVLLPVEQAKAVLNTVERELLTPLGLRTLARGEPGYSPRYEGNPAQRDSAYHQGTVWPWLLGPFVEAWTRVQGDTKAARADARTRFVEPLLAGLKDAKGLYHLPEITDAEPPYASKGCPFQAWSLGELSRLALSVLK